MLVIEYEWKKNEPFVADMIGVLSDAFEKDGDGLSLSLLSILHSMSLLTEMIISHIQTVQNSMKASKV